MCLAALKGKLMVYKITLRNPNLLETQLFLALVSPECDIRGQIKSITLRFATYGLPPLLNPLVHGWFMIILTCRSGAANITSLGSVARSRHPNYPIKLPPQTGCSLDDCVRVCGRDVQDLKGSRIQEKSEHVLFRVFTRIALIAWPLMIST